METSAFFLLLCVVVM